jgi:CBS domain-containing protein
MEPTARDIMSTDLLTVEANSSLEDVVKLIVSERVTGVPVVDSEGRMVGVCSDYDIIRQFSKAKRKERDVFRKKIDYSKKVETVTTETLLSEIAEKFVTMKYRRLPVLDQEGRLVGIITRRDMMKVLFYQAKLNQ